MDLGILLTTAVARLDAIVAARLDRKRRATVLLRDLFDALVDCHEAYLACVESEDFELKRNQDAWRQDAAGRGPEPPRPDFARYRRLTRQWERSIDRLARLLDKQSRALRIFEKDAYVILTRYVAIEQADRWRVTPDEALRLTSTALDQLRPEFTGDEDEISFDVVEDAVSDLIRRRAEYGDLI